VRLVVYTDGSGTTGGPAGIAYVALGDGIALVKEGSLSLDRATNQQAEILAAAFALHEIEPGPTIQIISDSEYLVKGWNEYPKRKRKKNLAHWARLTAAVEKHRSVTFSWTRGHRGTPGNERADKLAGEARRAALERRAA
jgi:ribonuclease HI